MSQISLSSGSLYACEVRAIAAGPTVELDPGCQVCGSRRASPTFSVSDWSLQVVTCCECGTGFSCPMPNPAQVAAFYPTNYYGESGRKFSTWVETLVHFVGSRHARFLARFVPPDGRVLDVGCGRGTALSKLADRGLQVHGIEMSAAAAAGADPRAQIQIVPRLQDAGYPDDFFDLVIIWHVLEHMPDPRGTLEEIRRILRPKGKLVVAVPNYSSWQARWSGPAWFHLDQPRHLFHFPAAGLRRLLESCGFECRSDHHFSLRQNPFGWVQSVLNRTGWFPRNALYELLLRHSGSPAERLPLSSRLLLRSAFFLGMPIALGVEIWAAICRRGATVHVVTRARPKPEPDTR